MLEASPKPTFSRVMTDEIADGDRGLHLVAEGGGGESVGEEGP